MLGLSNSGSNMRSVRVVFVKYPVIGDLSWKILGLTTWEYEDVFFGTKLEDDTVGLLFELCAPEESNKVVEG